MTTNLQPIQTSVQQTITEVADPAYRAKIQKLVPTGWTVHGVRVPKLRALAGELRKTHKALTVDAVVQLLDTAFTAKEREPVLVYLFWLAALKRKLTPALWPQIDRWVDSIVDWEICDQLAIGIAVPIVAGELKLVDTLVQWTASPNPWRRRFTLATAAALNQKGHAHVAETLSICTPLLNDPEAIVRKAVGWALREASDHDGDTVHQFLVENKGSIARGVLTEGSKKLTEEQPLALVHDGVNTTAVNKPKLLE